MTGTERGCAEEEATVVAVVCPAVATLADVLAKLWSPGVLALELGPVGMAENKGESINMKVDNKDEAVALATA